MSKKQKDVKVNKKLMDLTVEKKVKKAFSIVDLGLLVTAIIAVGSIVALTVSLLKNNLPIVLGIVAIVLIILNVIFNFILCGSISKQLANAIVVPVLMSLFSQIWLIETRGYPACDDYGEEAPFYTVDVNEK